MRGGGKERERGADRCLKREPPNSGGQKGVRKGRRGREEPGRRVDTQARGGPGKKAWPPRAPWGDG